MYMNVMLRGLTLVKHQQNKNYNLSGEKQITKNLACH